MSDVGEPERADDMHGSGGPARVGVARPLTDWRFAGQLRESQKRMLDAVAGLDTEPLHLVAPPGSGKTLIGLQLAMRRGSRALVLAPTTTIRAQWAATARSLASGVWGDERPAARPGEVSERPDTPGELTVLTYQMLSVLESSTPFDALAEQAWCDELVAGGRSEQEAEAWLADLAESNRAAYRSGLRRRGRRLRREIVSADPAQLAAVLHPNVLVLIDRLVAHGVETIVLDECHHLLDHWAIVVHYLAGRIRQAGLVPQLVGLTATLPSLEDQEEYENYTGLLGEVDYEVPTPAVVKEGNLAPYRDLAWFVAPSERELGFLHTHEAQLERLIADTLGAADGIAFMEQWLCGDLALMSTDADAARRATRELELALAESYARDPALAEAASRVLLETEPAHPLGPLLGAAADGRASTEQRIRLLARYALDRILPFPERAALWHRTKTTLADFGYLLTDRGIRRGREPVDRVLATSEAKDLAVGDILRLELASDTGDRMSAVVILDFAVHGHGGGRAAERVGSAPAGALRCFDALVADPALIALRPVLVTAKHLRIAARDAPILLPRLAEPLAAELAGAPIEVEELAEHPGVLALGIPGAGPSAIVRAVSALVTDGTCRLLVGTRGLLGEGWDCPAVNTLIDLSSVATSSATQQLRGRTLRLDPAWPEKVAHNWTVTAVIDAAMGLDGAHDAARLLRKQGRIWGLTLETPTAIVRGIDHTLTFEQRRGLGRLLEKDRRAPGATQLNAMTREALTSRAATRERWGIGEPYLGRATEELVVTAPNRRVRPFVSDFTIEAVLAGLFTLVAAVGAQAVGGLLRSGSAHPFTILVVIATIIVGLLVALGPRGLRSLRLALRQFALPQTAYQGAALAIARTLHARGELPPIGADEIVVRREALGAHVAARYEVEFTGGTRDEQRLVLDALGELFAPIGAPRFLLEAGNVSFRWSGPASWLAARIARVFGHRSRFFAVPRALGRRRDDAQRFAQEWQRLVGDCVLHEINSPEKLALLTRARRATARPDAEARPSRRETWS